MELINITSLPYINGVPPTEETKSSYMTWFKTGDRLTGGVHNYDSSGSANKTDLKLLTNIESDHKNIENIATVVNKHTIDITGINETLKDISDGNVLETLNQLTTSVIDLQNQYSYIDNNVTENTSNIVNINSELGVKDTTKTIYEEILFLKNRVGSNPKEDINGEPDDDSTGTGILYRLNKTQENVSKNNSRITAIEDNIISLDLENVNSKLVDIREELGDKPDNKRTIYERLYEGERLYIASQETIDEIKTAIDFDSSLGSITVRLEDTNKHVATNKTSIENINSDITDIRNTIGDADTFGSIIATQTEMGDRVTTLELYVGDPTKGMYLDVVNIKKDLGTNENPLPNTIHARLSTVESQTSDLVIRTNDLKTKLESDDGVIKTQERNSKLLLGDAGSLDEFNKNGVVKTCKQNEFNIGVNTLGNETGIYKLIKDLTARVNTLEQEKANYLTKEKADLLYQPITGEG